MEAKLIIDPNEKQAFITTCNIHEVKIIEWYENKIHDINEIHNVLVEVTPHQLYCLGYSMGMKFIKNGIK